MVSTCCLSKETPPAHLAELWPLEPLYTANQHYVHTVLIVVAIVVFTSLNLLRMCVIIVQTSLILILSITHPVCLLCHSMMYSLMIPIPPINYFPANTLTGAGWLPQAVLSLIPCLSQPSFHPSQDERPGLWGLRNKVTPCFSLVSCPPHACLPVRNGLVNEVEFLGLISQNGGRPMRLRDR